MLITPTCACVVDELLTLRACGMKRHTQATIRLTLKFRTVITTKLHYTEVHMERQISEVTFGIDKTGPFHEETASLSSGSMMSPRATR